MGVIIQLLFYFCNKKEKRIEWIENEKYCVILMIIIEFLSSYKAVHLHK